MYTHIHTYTHISVHLSLPPCLPPPLPPFLLPCLSASLPGPESPPSFPLPPSLHHPPFPLSLSLKLQVCVNNECLAAPGHPMNPRHGVYMSTSGTVTTVATVTIPFRLSVDIVSRLIALMRPIFALAATSMYGVATTFKLTFRWRVQII